VAGLRISGVGVLLAELHHQRRCVMNRSFRCFACLFLVCSFAASAQQTQTSTPSSVPPAAIHHRSAHSATSKPTSSAQSAPVVKSVPLSNNHHYVNSSGSVVHSPALAPSVPSGASAVCGDGSYSFSQHARGTCSHHGGVARWM
jgi:hypothetical protein